MAAKKHLVKRAGHKEPFDDRKIYASVYAACRTVRMTEGEAEMCADHVTKSVAKDISKKKEVTSDHLAKVAHASLEEINPDAAYMYRTHLDIS